jgi:tetratricopeptide (TPR) repeat protein
MGLSIEERFARAEAVLAADPVSVTRRTAGARGELLALLSYPEMTDDPRRIEYIAWLLDHDPWHPTLMYAYVDPATQPDAYLAIKAKWLALANATPPDTELVREAAQFISGENFEHAKALVQRALEFHPEDAGLWLELARYSEDHRERLAASEKAYAFDDNRARLLVWIAIEGFRAQDYAKAEGAANALKQLAAKAFAQFGDKLNLPLHGSAFWERADEHFSTRAAAREFVNARSDYVYFKHWANTVLGLLAFRRGDLDGAIAHLRSSADLEPDYQFSGGPSLDLLREVCVCGRWGDALAFLRKGEGVWNEPLAQEWIAAVEARKLPESETHS